MARKGSFEQIQANIEQHKTRKDLGGYTALMYVVMSQKYDCAKLLAKYELKIQNAAGQTALILCALTGFHKFIPLLIEEQKLQDNFGKTALYYACEYNRLECTKLLLSEANIPDKKNKLPLQVAWDKGCQEIGELIENYSKMSSDEQQSYMQQMMREHEEVVQQQVQLDQQQLPYAQLIQQVQNMQKQIDNNSQKDEIVQLRNIIIEQNQEITQLKIDTEKNKQQHIKTIEQIKQELQVEQNNLQNQVNQLNQFVVELKNQLKIEQVEHQQQIQGQNEFILLLLSKMKGDQ